MIKFSKTHEWAKIEGNIAIVGISDHAQHELGDVVFVELPKIGAKVKQASLLTTVESTKAAAEVYAPLSGEVIEVNKSLSSGPQLVNESPYEKGWIVKIKIADPKESGNLMDEPAYKEFLKTEKH
jgi:glycine cleavage system H protein